MLYDDGYTIKGVQRLLRDGAVKASQPEASGDFEAAPTNQAEPANGEVAASGSGLDPRTRSEISEVLDELVFLRNKLLEVRR